MGLAILIKDVVFTKNIGSLLPSASNLIGHWLFGSDLTEGIKNKVTGVAGALVNNPTVTNGKINIDKANGFITDIQVVGEKTFVVIAKSSSKTILLGSANYDSADLSKSEGIGVFDSKPLVQVDGGGKPLSTNTIDLNKVHFIAGAIGVSNNSLYVSSNGALTEQTVGHSGDLNDPSYIRIGGWGVASTSIVGTAEVYEAMVFNKKLSSAEVQAVFDYLKGKLSNVVID